MATYRNELPAELDSVHSRRVGEKIMYHNETPVTNKAVWFLWIIVFQK